MKEKKGNKKKEKMPKGGWLADNGGNLLNTVGGAALGVAGVVASPFTAGASLGLTAAGAGMVAKGVQGFGDVSNQNVQEALALQQQGINNQLAIPQALRPTMALGGNVQGLTPVELEKDEVYQTPDGNMGQVDAPSHEQGGIDMSLPAETFVWSSTLKDDDGVTFADRAARLGKLKAKYEKILNKK
mgnify:CR=1 FL=1